MKICSSMCYGDVLSQAPLHFDLEDYTDHVNTLTIHPLELAKKNYVHWPEDEFVKEYSDYADELKDILSFSNGLLISRDWILHNLEVLEKAEEIYKKERIGIFVKIYFPETFLDWQWLNILWNFYCNLSKKTDIKILVYTHMDYGLIKKLSKKFIVKLENKDYVECVYPVSTWDKIKYFFSKIKNVFKTNR